MVMPNSSAIFSISSADLARFLVLRLLLLKSMSRALAIFLCCLVSMMDSSQFLMLMVSDFYG